MTTTIVLDASAVLRFADDEAGADRVEALLRACVSGQISIRMSAIQWGEVAGKLRSEHGPAQQARILSTLLPSEVEIVPATAERAVLAAELRIDRKISYADAFALSLTTETSDTVLVTADYGFKPVADLVKIEFLPAK
jgi:PIN domain nuclease of toxin-antitoxin system